MFATCTSFKRDGSIFLIFLFFILKHYVKEKKELQRRIEKIVDEIREVTKENKTIDKNIAQMNVQFFDVKSKSDPSVIDQLRSINDSRFVYSVYRRKWHRYIEITCTRNTSL